VLEVNSRIGTKAQTGISIAEAARCTGVSVHTLRYYERAGVTR
jgi:MerR family regulatory protein